MLEDIAVLTGGRALTEDLGLTLEMVDVTDLGSAKKITIDKDTTTIIEGGGTKQASRRGSSSCARRSKTPSRTTTAKSCRSGSRSSPAAWR